MKIKTNVAQVTTLTLLEDGKTAYVVTNDKHLVQRIKAAQQKYPNDVGTCDAIGGCQAYRLPFSWLDITSPLRLSAAERMRRGERIKAAQKCRKGHS